MWNLAVSSVTPVDSLPIGADSAANNISVEAPPPVLHKLLWAEDGHSLLVGTSSGTVFAVTVANDALRQGKEKGWLAREWNEVPGDDDEYE